VTGVIERLTKEGVVILGADGTRYYAHRDYCQHVTFFLGQSVDFVSNGDAGPQFRARSVRAWEGGKS
jgi:hypothetical protein